MPNSPVAGRMDLRAAGQTDVDGVRRVARASLAASYGDTRERAVETWYDPDTLGDEIAAEDSHFVVAVDDGRVVGFAQAYRVEAGTTVGRIDWLHVHPDARGQDLGSQLLGRVETELLGAGVQRLEGNVIESNEAGAAFYADHGYERSGEREIDLGDRTLSERTLVRIPSDDPEARDLVAGVEADGRSLWIAYDESTRGSRAPFFVAYDDPDREIQYSWFCGGCETAVTAMDSMGRVECEACGNRRKPTRWDSAYL